MLVAGAPTSLRARPGAHAARVRAGHRTRHGLPLRIGVTRTRLLRRLGPPFRRTFSVKGDAINLAARVMGKARRGRYSRRRTSSPGRPRSLPPRIWNRLVKGKVQPVNASRVGAARRDRRRRPPHHTARRTRERARGSTRIAAGRSRLGGLGSRPGRRARRRKVAPPRRASIPRGRRPRPRCGLRGVRGRRLRISRSGICFGGSSLSPDGRPGRRGRPAGGADVRHRTAASWSPAHRHRAGPRGPPYARDGESRREIPEGAARRGPPCRAAGR